jgi:hypothetical protein
MNFLSRIVLERISDPATMAHIDEFHLFQLEITTQIEQCEYALRHLKMTACSPPVEYLILALKSQVSFELKTFRIGILLRLFRLFSVVRRKELIEIAGGRLAEDITAASGSLPTAVRTPEKLLSELERFPKATNVEFDIETDDGKHFTFSCGKLYD